MPYMRDEAFTLSRLHAVHARRFQHVSNSAHVRHTCAMNVYTIIHVRRTPVRRACTSYMYDSVNTALTASINNNETVRDRMLVKRCLHYHTCTPYMYGEHVRRTCAMNVYTIIHVRRTCMIV